ncbi:unnamed protein product [Rotaria sordida]|uniref:Protein kinase domain-containing protein n=1 Tax=Rotaria sordida TaxID=392033 RepID=A0A813N5Q6_9BILA|nr:unnamed protein product [Rotaria sordida]CAF0746697.1 unnamed protein product [Rotaria sordida]
MELGSESLLGLVERLHADASAAGAGTPYLYQKYWQDSFVHGRPYGSKADVWSLGAILYYMPYGKPSKYNPRAANPPHG